jgi:hypothetical protein
MLNHYLHHQQDVNDLQLIELVMMTLQLVNIFTLVLPFYFDHLEHGTPPKTPRTTRRNRIDDQSSIQVNSSLIIWPDFIHLFNSQHQWILVIF